MALSFDLTIITPERSLYHGRARSLVVPGTDGYLGVLARHAPMVATLQAGVLSVVEDDGDKVYFSVTSGVLEVSHDAVTILADAGELSSEIDVTRAQAAEQRARERLHERQPDLDMARAEAALQRASARLQATEKARGSR